MFSGKCLDVATHDRNYFFFFFLSICWSSDMNCRFGVTWNLMLSSICITAFNSSITVLDDVFWWTEISWLTAVSATFKWALWACLSQLLPLSLYSVWKFANRLSVSACVCVCVSLSLARWYCRDLLAASLWRSILLDLPHLHRWRWPLALSYSPCGFWLAAAWPRAQVPAASTSLPTWAASCPHSHALPTPAASSTGWCLTQGALAHASTSTPSSCLHQVRKRTAQSWCLHSVLWGAHLQH